MTTKVLAIDLGASSGRGIVAEFDGSRIRCEEVHRFPNGAVERDGRLYWDIDGLMREITAAIKKADEQCGRISSVGIDTWGVDFGIVGKDGGLLDDPRHYRDKTHTDAKNSLIDKKFSLYSLAGVSDNDFNTTYQLFARKKEGVDFSQAQSLLFMPQLVGYLLTGKEATEPTIASTSGFFIKEKGFDKTFLGLAGINEKLFPEVSETGEVLGYLKRDIRDGLSLGYDVPVVLTAGHDTACAVLAVPSEDKYPLYLSSGTWSLFGTLEDKPIINKTAFEKGYTNELAFDGRVRLIRNIVGMWIIQQCRKEWEEQGISLSYAELASLAAESKKTAAYIDVDDPVFIHAGNMVEKVKESAYANSGIRLCGIGEIADCIYRSLAKAYKKAYRDLCALTGRTYGRLHVIGGGANNGYLNGLIAEGLGIPVWAGPAEASALGNALGQLVGLKAITKDQIKDLILKSQHIEIYQ